MTKELKIIKTVKHVAIMTNKNFNKYYKTKVVCTKLSKTLLKAKNDLCNTVWV